MDGNLDSAECSGAVSAFLIEGARRIETSSPYGSRSDLANEGLQTIFVTPAVSFKLPPENTETFPASFPAGSTSKPHSRRLDRPAFLLWVIVLFLGRIVYRSEQKQHRSLPPVLNLGCHCPRPLCLLFLNIPLHLPRLHKLLLSPKVQSLNSSLKKDYHFRGLAVNWTLV